MAVIQGQPDSLRDPDCIQSTDYLYTKGDVLVNLDSSG
jgi:hypothetical protein